MATIEGAVIEVVRERDRALQGGRTDLERRPRRIAREGAGSDQKGPGPWS